MRLYFQPLSNHPPARRQLVAAIRIDDILGHEERFCLGLIFAYNLPSVEG
jgi:hypothetical protein